MKEPIKLNSCRPFLSAGDSFGERIIGNYALMGAHVSPKDLLFLLTAPPELPEDLGGMTTLVASSSVTDLSSVTLEVTNHILNRILLMETPQFTYQDQVYLSTALQKLGITDVTQFVEEVRLTREENRSVAALLQLYVREAPRLRPVRTGEAPAGKTRAFSAPEGETAHSAPPASRYYLHDSIYTRLQTGAVYQAIHSITQNFFENGPLGTAPNLRFSEQVKVSRLLTLSRQRRDVFEEAPLTLFQLENRYELGELLPPPRTEAQVLSQAAEAALLSTVNQVFTHSLTQAVTGGDLWLDLSTVIRQTAENAVLRFESHHAQTSRFQQVTSADQSLILDLYREETGLLQSYRELRVALERETGHEVRSAPEPLPSPAMDHPADTREGDVSQRLTVLREGERRTLENRERTDLTRQILFTGTQAAAPVRPAPAPGEGPPAKKREPTLRELQLVSKRSQTVHYLRDIAAWEQELISLVQSGLPPAPQQPTPGPRGPAGAAAPLSAPDGGRPTAPRLSGGQEADRPGGLDGTPPVQQPAPGEMYSAAELTFRTEPSPGEGDSLPGAPITTPGGIPEPYPPRTAEPAAAPTPPVRPGERDAQAPLSAPAAPVSVPPLSGEAMGIIRDAPPAQDEGLPPRAAENAPPELIYRVESAPSPVLGETRESGPSGPRDTQPSGPPASQSAPGSQPAQAQSPEKAPLRPVPLGPRPPLYFFPSRSQEKGRKDDSEPPMSPPQEGAPPAPATLVHRVQVASEAPETDSAAHTQAPAGREAAPSASPAASPAQDFATVTGLPAGIGSGGTPNMPQPAPHTTELVYRTGDVPQGQAQEIPPHTSTPAAPDDAPSPGTAGTLEREVTTLLRETVSSVQERLVRPGQTPPPPALTHRAGETAPENEPSSPTLPTFPGHEAEKPAPSRETAVRDGTAPISPSLSASPGEGISFPQGVIPPGPTELVYRTGPALSGETSVPPASSPQAPGREEARPAPQTAAGAAGGRVPLPREALSSLSVPVLPQTGLTPPPLAALVHPAEDRGAEGEQGAFSPAAPTAAAAPVPPRTSAPEAGGNAPAKPEQSAPKETPNSKELLREVLKDILPRREAAFPAADPPAAPVEAGTALPPEALILLAQTPAGEEARNELVLKELTELDRRNRTFQERLTEVRQRSAQRPTRAVPDRARTMADALRALEAPQQVLRELHESAPQSREAAPGPAELEFLLGSADEATRAIFSSALLYEKDPQAALRQGMIRPGSQAALNAESARREREETLLLRQLETLRDSPAGDTPAVSPLRPFLAEGGTRAEAPASQAPVSRAPLSFVHKTASDTFTEELYERLEEQRLRSVQPQTSTEQVRHREVRETETSETTRKLAAQTTEDITALINRTLSKQMGAISDKVYQQMEKRLQAERYRRGRF